MIDLPEALVCPVIHTERLELDPVVEEHAQELWDLFNDRDLHHFVPFELISIEKQRERCSKWSKRRSPDGSELWLNWLARDRATKNVVAHFQAGLKEDGVASIGYLVSREFQNRGIATEGLKAVITHLEKALPVCEIRAYSDTRNKASHRVAAKLGMVQVEFIKDADFFKGASSDEFVFSKKINTGSRNGCFMFTLETKHLLLRPLHLDDLPSLHKIFADPITFKAWPSPFTEEQTLAWINRALDSYLALGFGRLAVVEKRTGILIGDCGLMKSQVNGVYEIDLGYILFRDFWGNGYATEAAQAVLNYAKEVLRVPRIVANMGADNIASRRVAEKIGFKLEREFLNQRNRNLPTLLFSSSV